MSPLMPASEARKLEPDLHYCLSTMNSRIKEAAILGRRYVNAVVASVSTFDIAEDALAPQQAQDVARRLELELRDLGYSVNISHEVQHGIHRYYATVRW